MHGRIDCRFGARGQVVETLNARVKGVADCYVAEVPEGLESLAASIRVDGVEGPLHSGVKDTGECQLSFARGKIEGLVIGGATAVRLRLTSGEGEGRDKKGQRGREKGSETHCACS